MTHYDAVSEGRRALFQKQMISHITTDLGLAKRG